MNVTAAPDTDKTSVGIMDSGATVTIGGKRGMFTDLRPCDINVLCANKQSMHCSWMRTVAVASDGETVAIDNSLFIPGCMTLISISQLARLGFTTLFDKLGVELFRRREDIGKRKPVLKPAKRLTKKLYTVPVKLLSKYHDNEFNSIIYFLGNH